MGKVKPVGLSFFRRWSGDNLPARDPRQCTTFRQILSRTTRYKEEKGIDFGFCLEELMLCFASAGNENSVLALHGEVMACGYEDVRVMWSILDKSKAAACNLTDWFSPWPGLLFMSFMSQVLCSSQVCIREICRYELISRVLSARVLVQDVNGTEMRKEKGKSENRLKEVREPGGAIGL